MSKTKLTTVIDTEYLQLNTSTLKYYKFSNQIRLTEISIYCFTVLKILLSKLLVVLVKFMYKYI